MTWLRALTWETLVHMWYALHATFHTFYIDWYHGGAP